MARRREFLRSVTTVPVTLLLASGRSFASVPDNETLSFENWARGNPKPPDPWKVLNEPGTIELSNDVSSEGSKSIHVASHRRDLKETRAGVNISLNNVETIFVDVYVEASNIYKGYLTVHLDKENKLIRLDNRESGEWYRDMTADVSDFSGEHTLVLRAVGNGNDAYFDNIRFKDSSGNRIDVTEITTADDGKSDDSEEGSNDENKISVGEKVTGKITDNNQKEPLFNSFHADAWELAAKQDDEIEIKVSGVPYFVFKGPNVDTFEYRNETFTVEESKTYTIYPFDTDSLPEEYSLSVTNSNDHYQVQVVDADRNPKQDVRVRLLTVPTPGFGPDNPGIVRPKADAIELVSEATTDDDGYAVFDGTNNSGRVLRVDDLDNIASEYDGHIAVAAWTPDTSQPWFQTWLDTPQKILSNDWNDKTLPLNNQILFGPTDGGHTDGRATVWRSLKPDGKRRQDIYISVSGGKVGVGDSPSRMAHLTSGIISVGVPEDLKVINRDKSDQDNSGNELYFVGNQSGLEYNRAPVAGSLMVSNSYPSLPPYASLRNTVYQPYNDNVENVAKDIRSAFIGNLKLVSTIIEVGGDLIDLLNLGSDSEKADHTIGSGTEISRNEYDLISTAWDSRHFNFVYKVPVEFPDEKERMFAARAKWFAEENNTVSKVNLDVPLRFGPS